MRCAGFLKPSAIAATAVMAATVSLLAGSAEADKSGYHFFNPTPVGLLRELSPDRPDKTESPFTLDAGHFMLEMDFANFTYDQTAGATTRVWNIAPFNLKAGLLNNVDLQFGFDNYLHVRTTDRTTGTTTTQTGLGDLTTRLKINLWGNDGGRTAFALLPFIKFPTSSGGLGNNVVEGGLILPLAVQLPENFGLGLETAFSVLRDNRGSGYHGDFINSVTVGHDLMGRLGGYVEFFSDISTESHSGWVGTVDAGLTFSVSENIQLDLGCNFGITSAADDFNPFSGLTWRF